MSSMPLWCRCRYRRRRSCRHTGVVLILAAVFVVIVVIIAFTVVMAVSLTWSPRCPFFWSSLSSGGWVKVELKFTQRLCRVATLTQL